MKRQKLAVLGFGNRGGIYAQYATKFPDQFELVAAIDNDCGRIGKIRDISPTVPVFYDYHDFLQAKIPCDIVAVCTQDKDHLEHACAMMRAGYHLLLEKPVATTAEDCLEILRTAKECNRTVVVCHVLRYTPFYSTLKNLIDEGTIGEVFTINASENVGYFHHAHSFVRGPWRNEQQSCPMILAKCCHDMDIIRWLVGEPCLSVNSYGSLSHYTKENAPKGHTKYCSDCPHLHCPYKAQTLYAKYGVGWLGYYITNREQTVQNILEDLAYGQYDRCVYECDNDVVDHQQVLMNFANGKTATHTMTAFSRECYRDIKIHGTKGEIYGSMESEIIEVRPFGKEAYREEIKIPQVVGGHGGGDYFMMQSLYNFLNGKPAPAITTLDVSIESHLMGFCAEQSRHDDGNSKKIPKNN